MRNRSSVRLVALSAACFLAACSSDTATSPEAASLALATKPAIVLNPTSLTFYARRIYGGAASQKVTITSTGGGFDWTAASNRSWLLLSKKSGHTPSNVYVSVNISGLPYSFYQGHITVSAAGASNSPQTLPVILHIR